MNKLGGLTVGGLYEWELVRDGEVIDSSAGKIPNKTTTEGLEALGLENILGSGTPEQLYVALMGTAKAGAELDTYAAIMSSANYESVDYDETTRPAYTTGAASGLTISNSSSVASFKMKGTDTTINGAMLCNDSTKDDNTASKKLLSIAQFDSAITGIQDDDRVKVTVTLTISTSTGE